ncbi:hypothetical protein BcepSauron_167 [Burkholderia phage BcepSauron]|uniref:Uncharacterized protein n=1 Tax=Burkholderia phage BcepSauron TaxID=2530033 RepID=A0A482MKJ2_9CAUD|nr:hypothetical protein H1O17_gp167 [Burkholderia phage BcepSauron]QBQ74547.1 hypothetical protein BcepSauron_167 [Burkholderia phage BcepSauron]
MSKKFEKKVQEQYGITVGTVHGLVSARYHADGNGVTLGAVPVLVLEVLNDKKAGTTNVIIADYTDLSVQLIVSTDDDFGRLTKLSEEEIKAANVDLRAAEAEAIERGFKPGQKIDGARVLAFVKRDKLYAIVDNKEALPYFLAIDAGATADSLNSDAKALRRVEKRLEKLGIALDDLVLVDRTSTAALGTGVQDAVGLFYVAAVTAQGVTLAQDAGTPVGLEGNPYTAAQTRVLSKGVEIEGVPPEALIKPLSLQQTSRGTEWSAEDVLAARYGFLIGDQVETKDGTVGGTISKALFATYPGDTVGDVLVIVGGVSETDDAVIQNTGTQILDPMGLNLTNPRYPETGFALGAAVRHSVQGLGQVVTRVAEGIVRVNFFDGTTLDVHEEALESAGKVRFSELGLLQPFKVGEQSFIKVGGSTAIAVVIPTIPNSEPVVALARSAVDVAKSAKRSFKQSDKVSLFSNAL